MTSGRTLTRNAGNAGWPGVVQHTMKAHSNLNHTQKDSRKFCVPLTAMEGFVMSKRGSGGQEWCHPHVTKKMENYTEVGKEKYGVDYDPNQHDIDGEVVMAVGHAKQNGHYMARLEEEKRQWEQDLRRQDERMEQRLALERPSLQQLMAQQMAQQHAMWHEQMMAQHTHTTVSSSP